jgi:hypothetical protein
MRNLKTHSYISPNKIISVFYHSPWSYSNSANLPRWSGSMFFEGITNMFCHTCSHKILFHLTSKSLLCSKQSCVYSLTLQFVIYTHTHTHARTHTHALTHAPRTGWTLGLMLGKHATIWAITQPHNFLLSLIMGLNCVYPNSYAEILTPNT